jgi:hypothetical protein
MEVLMKKLSTQLILLLISILLLSGVSGATIYTFNPSPPDLYDLDHSRYYTWGINWSKPANEVITGASITFNNIYDWTYEPDILYTHLLDSATVGVQFRTDNEGGGDHFASQGVLIGTWSDPYGDWTHRTTKTFVIGSSNFDWLADGNFGFGIDPDCHYYNDGVVAKIETRPVPEPSTMLLLGFGLIGLTGFGRKKLFKK